MSNWVCLAMDEARHRDRGEIFNNMDRHLPRLSGSARRVHRCTPSVSSPPTGALSRSRWLEDIQVLDGVQMFRRASASLHPIATPEIWRCGSYRYVVFAVLKIARSRPYVQARTSFPSAMRPPHPPFLVHQAHARAHVRLHVSHPYAFS